MPQAIFVPVLGDIKMIEVTRNYEQWYKFINHGEHTTGYIGYLFGDYDADRYCHVYSDDCNDNGVTPQKLPVNYRMSTTDDICYGDAIIFLQNDKNIILEMPPVSPEIVQDFLIKYPQLEYTEPEHMKTVRQFVEAAGFDCHQTTVVNQNIDLFDPKFRM